MIGKTEATAILKENYTKDAIVDLARKKDRFRELIPKNTKIGGEDFKIPVISAYSARRSCDFDAALAIADNTGYQAFKMTAAQDYAIASWTGKILKQTEGDENAFGRILKLEMDRAIRAAYRSQAIKLYRNGTGSVGVIDASSTVASATIILASPGDIHNFEVGEQVGASATDGGALLGSPSYVTISAINRSAATLTTAGGNWSTQIGSLATGAFLFKRGDAQNNGDKVAIEGWLSFGPASSASLTTPFYNVTRSVDQGRLACLFKDNSSDLKPIDEFLVDCVSDLLTAGSDPDFAMLNPRKYRTLINRAQTKLVRSNNKKAEVGFGAVELLCDDGVLPVYSDVNAPEANVFMGQMDTWELVSPGESIGILEDDKNEILRVYNKDGYEVRIGGYPQTVNHAPGHNLTGTLG